MLPVPYEYLYRNYLNLETNTPPERCRKLHEEWLEMLCCPLLHLDGTKPVDELLKQIMDVIE